MTELEELKTKHAKYVARAKANGAYTFVYKVPCCGREVEDVLANEGQLWDTFASCPHCGGLYWKVATDKAITVGAVP